MSDYVPIEYPKDVAGVVVNNADEEKVRLDSMSPADRKAWLDLTGPSEKINKEVRDKAAKAAAAEAEAFRKEAEATSAAGRAAVIEGRAQELRSAPVSMPNMANQQSVTPTPAPKPATPAKP